MNKIFPSSLETSNPCTIHKIVLYENSLMRIKEKNLRACTFH